MVSALPIFPLGTVVYPGSTLAVHVFEPRYVELVEHLQLHEPDEQCFGVVAIREGYEVGDRNVRSLHRIGTEVRITGLRERRSTYDLEAVGVSRFQVERIHTEQTYLTADVRGLPDTLGGEPADAARRAAAVFDSYTRLMRRHGAEDVEMHDDVEDALALSYALADAARLTLRDRQGLLEAPDAATRLRQVTRLLVAELTAMRAVPSLPAVDIARTAWSPN